MKIDCSNWQKEGYSSEDACIRDKTTFTSIFGDATIFANQIAQITKRFNEKEQNDNTKGSTTPPATDEGSQ